MDSLSGLPSTVGVLATIQYLGLIPRMVSLLESSGRKAFVGSGDSRICYPGQVLGCNCSSAESIMGDVEAFLFLGEGDFHPLAAAFGVQKTVFVLNPVTGEVRDMAETRDRILRRRFAAIQAGKNADSFLVIVCTKIGQKRMIEAEEAVKKIKAHGKKAFKAVMEEVTPTSLMAYRVDAYVNTACPRIAMDDSARYDRPMLTLSELDIVLGEKSWNEYEFDQIRPSE